MLYNHPRIYDELYDNFTEDIPFYQALARESTGPVCELACGSGRVTVPLAAEGIPVTGIDLSPPMVDAARLRAARAGLGPENPSFCVGDMSDPLPGAFSLVIVPLHSLSHLTGTARVRRCLENIHRGLSPGGVLALAVHNPDMELLAREPEGLFPVTMAGEEVPIFESSRYDALAQVLSVRWWAEGEDTLEPFDFSLRMFFPEELVILLEGAGFQIRERFGWYDRSPLTGGSGTQIVVATRA
ncbi:Methyltransferase domain-containing protein [Alkalispirochaeta americana]|uniref:Methyltransferase domain-containing protein n=1 Tax=Alkalispirochaeta americana TaxID=159291 RepID=A0A1N6SCS4_9SPIO|nr:class I SAM-dependent methyltransferase [Alkalispirochaeta americana]SIQ38840.1 Methyltransferase domain-containing protein [Alkalispirochaeta americana]